MINYCFFFLWNCLEIPQTPFMYFSRSHHIFQVFMHDLDDVPQMNQIAFALAPGLHAGVEVGKTVVSRICYYFIIMNLNFDEIFQFKETLPIKINHFGNPI